MKIIPLSFRTPQLFICGVLAFGLAVLHSEAEEPAPATRPPMVEIEARFVRATLEQMNEAVGVRSSKDAAVMLTPEQFEKAVSTLKAAKADFFSHSRAVTKSGRKAVIQSVRELRYPSEYEPSKEDPTKFLPTAFDTKDVGVVLEYKPSVANNDGDSLIVDLVVSVVDFLGFIDASVPDEKLNFKTPEELKELTKAAIPEGAKWVPIFPSKKVTTSVAQRSGQTWLFEHFAPSETAVPERDSSGFFIFITARVIPPK